MEAVLQHKSYRCSGWQHLHYQCACDASGVPDNGATHPSMCLRPSDKAWDAQEDNHRLSQEVAELKVAMTYLANNIRSNWTQQQQAPQQLPDAGQPPTGPGVHSYGESGAAPAPQGPYTSGSIPEPVSPLDS